MKETQKMIGKSGHDCTINRELVLSLVFVEQEPESKVGNVKEGVRVTGKTRI